MDFATYWPWWLWLLLAAIFTVGEIATPGTFFLGPFAVGAVVALILALLDLSIATQWISFVVVSSVSFAALRPLARRLSARSPDQSFGSPRLVGQEVFVVEEVGGYPNPGVVNVGSELWRASTEDGSTISPGEYARVVEVQGTRVVLTSVPKSPGDGQADGTTNGNSGDTNTDK